MTATILVGHVLKRLADLAPESVHCVVTSPPYYGLRDYGIEPQMWGDGWRGSLGLEPTLDLYLDHMVEVFRAVRRVMRKDATCWLNIGDSYCSTDKWGGGKSGNSGKHTVSDSGDVPSWAVRERKQKTHGLKPKDLMLIPFRLAIRLQDNGWWVRQDNAWCKKAPMPESCTDRPTSAWEHVFLLSKSAHYFYDAEAVKEEANGDAHEGRKDGLVMAARGGIETGGAAPSMPRGIVSKRNLRNFWLLGPSPYPEAHFATFPPSIPEICIKAGTSERGVCPKCGAPWTRITKTKHEGYRANGERLAADERKVSPTSVLRGNGRDAWTETETIGWQPTCSCAAGDPVSSTVLDPFLGAGTTALVADQLGRNCIGIELNPQYAEMAHHRIKRDAGMFATIDVW